MPFKLPFKLSKIPTLWLIVLLTLVGASVRLWQLDSLPGVLHRDETSIAYNAYSLLLTGKDEHGMPWPISFQAFGDYKLPGLIYATMVSVWIFDLSVWAVRLPTSLAAILTIPTAYWLSRELGWSKRICLIATLLITFSFWHISQARNAYEPMVGLLFSGLSWASWLRAQKKSMWYGPAILSYFLGSLFYNVPFLLLPLLFVGSWLITKLHQTKALKFERSDSLPVTAIGVLIIVIVGLSWLLQGVNASRTQTTLFNHPELQEKSSQLVHAGLVAGLPSPLSRALNHSFVDGVIRSASGYLVSFNPRYLFFEGDGNHWHNLRSIGLGNLNPVLLPLLLIGVFVLVDRRQQLAAQLTLFYLLVSPFISALTIDAPITNRLLDFHLAILIISAVGIDLIYRSLWRKNRLISKSFFYWRHLTLCWLNKLFSTQIFLHL